MEWAWLSSIAFREDKKKKRERKEPKKFHTERKKDRQTETDRKKERREKSGEYVKQT